MLPDYWKRVFRCLLPVALARAIRSSWILLKGLDAVTVGVQELALTRGIMAV